MAVADEPAWERRDWSLLERRSQRGPDPGLPIKLGSCSNGEYTPAPVSPAMREAARRARRACAEAADRLGMSRRTFLRSSMASAATLLALGACSKESRRGGDEPAGDFDVPTSATTEPEVADSVLGDDGAPIVDVQQHLLEPGPDGQGFGSGFPQADCGDGPACFDTAHWLELVFGRSDTTLAVLSAIPVIGEPDPLSAEVMARARAAAEEACGDGRVLVQGHAQPNVGPPQAALDAMRAERERFDLSAWKAYTHAGPGWTFDDSDGVAVGAAFLGLVEEIGPPIVCVHKGLSGSSRFADPADIGPAAAAHPDLAFVVYHSGFEVGINEGPWQPGSPNGGIDRLLESLRAAGIGPGGNVYAELGSTWRTVMGDPDQAAHVIGKLLAYVGPDNVLWGTDSIWYGSPQDQIETFRALQIDAAAQERYGYPALTDEVKAKVLGGNAAALLGVDPAGASCGLSGADRAALRADPSAADVLLGPRTATAARQVFQHDHPWF